MEATELESSLENNMILTYLSPLFCRLEIGVLHVVLEHFVGWFPTQVPYHHHHEQILCRRIPCVWWLN